MIIGIHQPNFCPYNGFFEKMAQCDKFIILSYCQFEKNNYQNRFNDGDRWNGLTVSKKTELINDKMYLNPFVDWMKITQRHKNLEKFDECIDWSLRRTNTNIIGKTAKLLGIDTEIVHDYPTELKSTDRLIDLVKHYGGTTYLSGQSGKNYMELDKFEANDIKLEFHKTKDNKSFNEII